MQLFFRLFLDNVSCETQKQIPALPPEGGFLALRGSGLDTRKNFIIIAYIQYMQVFFEKSQNVFLIIVASMQYLVIGFLIIKE